MPATAQHCREYRQRLKKRVAEQHGTKCRTCGSNRRLQLAHRRPTDCRGEGRGQTNRLLDALKNPAAYILECVVCHRLRDGWSIP